MSKYCLSLFTYFPLVNFFEHVLIKIMDEIKIKRMTFYTDNPNSIEKIDIKYFCNEVKIIA